MPASPHEPDELLARSISEKLPGDNDPNQDLLFDFANGVRIEELAARYASGSIPNIRNRIRVQYGKLGMPLPYTDPAAMYILRRAFDLLDSSE